MKSVVGFCLFSVGAVSFLPQHFLHCGLQQRHAGHIRRRGFPPLPSQHRQHLSSEGGLHLWVAGQLVQGPGHGAGDLEKHAGARGQSD